MRKFFALAFSGIEIAAAIIMVAVTIHVLFIRTPTPPLKGVQFENRK